MGKLIFHNITGKLWPGVAGPEKQQLWGMMVTLTAVELSAVTYLIYKLVSPGESYCIYSITGIIAAGILAVGCLLNRKINCVLNTTFILPVLIYFCYLSELSSGAGITGAIYFSVAGLLAGAFFLFCFSDSLLKVALYSILSALTIGFQLLKNSEPGNLLHDAGQLSVQPLVAFLILVAGGFLLRIKFDKQAAKLTEKLNVAREGISTIIRDSLLPIAEIKIVRDEKGNVINLRILRVNRVFESTFNIQLHEVRDQEANYIFEWVLKEPFDLNKILLYESQKPKEFHALKLELWFRIHVLKPDYNTCYVMFENITRIKTKLAELENSKKRYKVLLEAIPDMFFVIGKDGTYEDFVIKESDIFKVDEANIVGSTIFDVGFPANMAEKIMTCIQTCIRYNSLETIEYSMNTPNGTYLFEMRLAKLNSHSVISVSRDITRRKNAEFNLEKALKKAEESDRLKSAFLANLSHEIRTPLNIITNFTRMLADENQDNPERMELVNAILQNGTQLMNMIENTIHLSKIETETVETNVGFCHINPLIRDIYVRYSALVADGRKVNMQMDLDAPNPSFGFYTDRRLLQESLQILVDNAVKYTLEGEIRLGYEMQLNESVKFMVSDSGIGVPGEEQERIFSRFYRVKNSINEVTSGSGLGLSIAQHYIRMLGGELQLESVPGKGSTFSFTLPFKNGEGYLRVVS